MIASFKLISWIPNYFLPKKDMIFPWPDFPPVFLPFPDDGAVDAGARTLQTTGSSSENDSHAGSSFVTVY